MDNLSILDVSMYQIKLFLLLAEERNFSRVAAMVNMTQPTLSKRISQLEQTLNMQLFLRADRPVSLTPAAKTLYDGWKTMIDQFITAISDAEERESSGKASLSIGISDSGNDQINLPVLLKQLLDLNSGLEVGARYLPFSSWRQRLLSDDIDIMITTSFEVEDIDEAFIWEQIEFMPQKAYMLATNPLAKKSSLNVADLKSQFFSHNSQTASCSNSWHSSEQY